MPATAARSIVGGTPPHTHRGTTVRTLRSLSRRKLRTTLTVLGIAIGIWALVVFGAMANRINGMIQNGSVMFDSGMITAWSGGGAAPKSNPMDVAIGEKFAGIAGVDTVVPAVGFPLTDDPTGITMGVPPTVEGDMPAGDAPGGDRARDALGLHAASGRMLTAADEGSNVVVLGCDLAAQYGKSVGDPMTIRGEEFSVVGVLAKTLTQPDSAAYVPFEAAQRMYVRTLPSLVAGSLPASRVVTTFMVYAKPGADLDGIAAQMRAIDPELGTMTPNDFDRSAGSYGSMLNALLVGIALISLAVGGLSVVNTMAMSVAERTREIGIKRAIGASRVRVLREIVTESGLIGCIGGLIGLALGAAVVVAANEAGRSSGTILFELTAGTSFSAVAFSTILGALAGFVPALHAARLDPVAALRYE